MKFSRRCPQVKHKFRFRSTPVAEASYCRCRAKEHVPRFGNSFCRLQLEKWGTYQVQSAVIDLRNQMRTTRSL